ncbi:MAG TPA: hypothetical protein VLS27_08305 [Gammaproteobacteria bacterium]|nr:hypothetical protein [Gammaproteobacteria bacterium]
MSDQGSASGASAPQPSTPDDDAAKIPFMQRLLDNPFLLLFLGVAIPTVLYVIWGVMEIVSIPIAQ